MAVAGVLALIIDHFVAIAKIALESDVFPPVSRRSRDCRQEGEKQPH
jgi:hypothetical protein